MEIATDYTMWALFARATLTVKLVMLLLVLASIWCWAVIIDKADPVSRRPARGRGL